MQFIRLSFILVKRWSINGQLFLCTFEMGDVRLWLPSCLVALRREWRVKLVICMFVKLFCFIWLPKNAFLLSIDFLDEKGSWNYWQDLSYLHKMKFLDTANFEKISFFFVNSLESFNGAEFLSFLFSFFYKFVLTHC